MSDLPAQVLVVHVTDKEGLGCESVRLDLHVSTGNLQTDKVRQTDMNYEKEQGRGDYKRKSQHKLRG